MTKVFKFNTNFDNGPAGFSTNANFRIKTKKEDLLSIMVAMIAMICP